MGYERIATIGMDHPSLAGHFPGRPVVPGVVMLGEIMEAVRQSVKRNIVFIGMPTAKFLSPLAPGERLVILLEQNNGYGIDFICQVGSRLVATGCLHYRQMPHGAKDPR
ncbi:MAG: 3-hydroxylacyl-ACP dehydratase [Nitrospiraceae bacterium]|nr:3-hydroxylacyl-ACP dehydratase [Nitrospiraceae bacterium]